MGGSPKEEAKRLKADGIEIYCIGITGDIKRRTLYDIATSPKHRNEAEHSNVFILQDYGTLSWLVHEIMNGTVDYSGCGLGLENVGVHHGRIIGGDRSREPWPWMAALYMTMGKEITSERELQCGGSIIYRHFILTAAHCMYKENKKRVENEITVKLGLTDLMNLTYLQEFGVRKIYVHPQYGIGRSFDYDIALLELERPVEYNTFIRPICLPPKEIPENSQFYKPKSLAWTTGWGYTRKMPKLSTRAPVINQFLKEIYVPIQYRDVCEESLKDDGLNSTYFTDRMFCTGEGEGDNDSCLGDTGGPVMQSATNEEGYLTWTQVGIVSWGIGCGIKDEYGFHTHLQKLMPWVDNTIKAFLKQVDLK